VLRPYKSNELAADLGFAQLLSTYTANREAHEHNRILMLAYESA
jgi:hypothetical protein